MGQTMSVQALLNYGELDIDSLNFQVIREGFFCRDTNLHRAVYDDNLELIEYLLDRGA